MGISLHERLDRAVVVLIQAFRLADMRAIESTTLRSSKSQALASTEQKVSGKGKLPRRIGLDKVVARRGIMDRVIREQIPPAATGQQPTTARSFPSVKHRGLLQ